MRQSVRKEMDVDAKATTTFDWVANYDMGTASRHGPRDPWNLNVRGALRRSGSGTWPSGWDQCLDPLLSGWGCISGS